MRLIALVKQAGYKHMKIERKKITRSLFFLASLFIVAFGQPSFIPWLGMFAAWVGYALFWRWALIYPSFSQRFLYALLWYGAVSLIQLSWMTSIEYQGIYMLFLMGGLAFWLGLQFGAITLLIPYNRSLSVGRLFAIASLWTLLEWGRFHVLCGYSWNPVGLALSPSYALQMAALFGVLGLSFWVILVNLFALRSVLKRKTSSFLIWGALGVTPYLFGLGYSCYHDMHKKEGRQFSCILVQTGLLPAEKVPLRGKIQAFISPYDQWKHILSLVAQQPNRKVDLVVLPESAVPFSSSQCAYSSKRVQQIFIEIFGAEVVQFFPPTFQEEVSNGFWTQILANFLGAEVIIGLDHKENEGLAHNSAFWFQPGGGEPSRYDKRILMPLAEYLPFECLRSLAGHYGVRDFFIPGQSASIFGKILPISVSICYEETFPQPIREGRKQGAKLLVNITNDAWYPFSRLPRQHFEHARLRAVENGAPLIRACNSGVTAAIDSLGREVARLEEINVAGELHAAALYTTIDTYEHSTPYLFWGDAGILWISFLLLGSFYAYKLFFYFWGLRLTRKQKVNVTTLQALSEKEG